MNYIHSNVFRVLPPVLSTSATRNLFKNVHYKQRPFRDNLQKAAKNYNYHKKVQIPVLSSQCSCYYKLCLFHYL